MGGNCHPSLFADAYIRKCLRWCGGSRGLLTSSVGQKLISFRLFPEIEIGNFLTALLTLSGRIFTVPLNLK